MKNLYNKYHSILTLPNHLVDVPHPVQLHPLPDREDGRTDALCKPQIARVSTVQIPLIHERDKSRACVSIRIHRLVWRERFIYPSLALVGQRNL